MKIRFFKTTILLALILYGISARPCSMFKITAFGKTMVGCNEDAWRSGARLWFENPGSGKYGAVFFSFPDLFPQGGMNEHGLCFDGFTIPSRELKIPIEKKQPQNPFSFIKEILKTCKTVIEVKNLLNEYDYTFLNQGMLLFVDSTGNYLVVEPDTMLLGKDAKYVLSNFCPSQTKDLAAVKIRRYQKGVRYLNTKTDTSLAFCTSMMDTMHVCREGLGDGTLYTNIYDTRDGIIYLYFYHDFKRLLKFDLKTELKKGDHEILISSAFPVNEEYKKLLAYKTPVNSQACFALLVFLAGLFLLSAFFFMVTYLISIFKKTAAFSGKAYKGFRLVVFATSALMLLCCIFLIRERAIVYLGFYHEAPFFSLYKVAAITPFIIAVAFIPFIAMYRNISRNSSWRIVSRSFLAINILACFICIVMFTYWGLYKLS